MNSAVIAGAMCLVFLSSCDKGQETSQSEWAGTIPSRVSWLKVEKGQQAYLGTDGGNSTSATVCDTSEEYSRLLSLRSGGSTDSPRGCRKRLQGVKLEMLDSLYDTANAPTLILQVRAQGWQGWTELNSLAPIVSPNTKLSCSLSSGPATTLDSARVGGSSVAIGETNEKVEILVLKTYPYGSNVDSWAIKVLDGPLKGRTGFMFPNHCVVPGTDEDADHFAWKADIDGK